MNLGGLCLFYFFLSLPFLIWIYSDARNRDMNGGAWVLYFISLGGGFFLGFVLENVFLVISCFIGVWILLIIYLIIRKPYQSRQSYYNKPISDTIYSTGEAERMHSQSDEIQRQYYTQRESFAMERERSMEMGGTPQPKVKKRMLIRCPYCGFLNEKDAKFCAHCGHALQVKKEMENLSEIEEKKEETRIETHRVSEKTPVSLSEHEEHKDIESQYSMNEEEKMKYIEKLDKWEKFGFPTAHLRKLMDEDIEEFRKLFEKTKRQLED